MDIEALEKLIKDRRSIRKWKKGEIPDELIKKAVELATWAPNGGNYQGWHFIVVKKKEVIEKMAGTLQSVADRIATWPESISWQEEVKRYQAKTSFFKEASTCIGVFVSKYQNVMDKVLLAREALDPEARRIVEFRRSAPTAIQSAAAAVTTMLLVFQQMGLGAVWLGSPLMAKTEIETILGVPESQSLVCLVALGYADEAPQKERKPVDQVLEWVR